MPLTKQERRERREQRRQQRLAEAEAYRRKIKKDELAAELVDQRKAKKLLAKRWNDMLQRESREQVGDYMHDSWKSFEHAINMKDWLIAELQSRIAETEMIRNKSFSDYIREVNDKLRYYGEEVEHQKEIYDSCTEESLQRKAETSEYLKARMADEEDYMKTILYNMAQLQKEHILTMNSEFISIADEEHTKESTVLADLNIAAEGEMDHLWKTYREIVANYKRETDKSLMFIKDLSKKVYHETNLIHDQEKAILVLRTSIQRYQFVIKTTRYKELEELREHEKTIKDLYKSIRQYTSDARQKSEIQLEELVRCSKKAISSLKTLEVKGTKILKMKKFCVKLQAADENTFPVSKEWTAQSVKELTGIALVDKMMKFWKATGKGCLIENRLRDEKRLLKQDNYQLASSLSELLKSNVNAHFIMKFFYEISK